MPLIKYGTVPSGRHNLYKQLELIDDLALLELSGKGHALYNLGHNSLLHIKHQQVDNLFSLPLTDTEIALSDYSRVDDMIMTIVDKGYKNLFLMPSAIAELTNFDYENFKYNIEDKFDIKVKYQSKKEYHSVENCLNEFVTKASNIGNVKKEGFAILGSVFSYESRRDAKYIRDFIENTYGEKCIFSNLDRFKLEDLSNIYRSKVIVTLDGDAKVLGDQINVRKVDANFIDIESEEKFLSELNEIFGKNVQVQYKDEYKIAVAQMKNLIALSNKKMIVFLENNLNERVDKFFRSVGINSEIYSPYKSKTYKTISIDAFINKYRESDNDIIISYDRIVKVLNKGINLESLGLDYYLITPTPSRRIMINGAFSLMEEITKKIKI